MLLLFSEYCRQNYEPVGSDRDVDDYIGCYCCFQSIVDRTMSNGFYRDVNDSLSDAIVVFRVLSRQQ